MRNDQTEEKKVNRLKKELALKKWQFSSIYEFSESIYSSFTVDRIIRIFFSTMMGQLGISRLFFMDSQNKLFRKRGFLAKEKEINQFQQAMSCMEKQWLCLHVDELEPEQETIRDFMKAHKIEYIVSISETDERCTILGLGFKLNKQDLNTENIEYAFLVSKFSLNAIDNAFMINRLIDTKRMEHELKIASDIQLALLPQSLPTLENFEISVIYVPINDVGGDYYDILKERDGKLPILIADVEGKGLSAALLATSSQAIFHSLNDLYDAEPGQFISKANEMIFDFTKGARFITLFWMLVDDARKSITYVNAGHVEPMLISKAEDTATPLSKGGFLTGFIGEAQYEKDTLQMNSGDIILSFTDGVPEVENKKGEEFDLENMVNFVKDNAHLTAEEITSSMYKYILEYSEGVKFRDDFTLIILKAK